MRHLAHCEYYLLKLIMSSHPSGIILNHGLRVRHRRIHTAENSQNVMSKWLSQQFLNIKPFFWQSVHFTPFWTKSSLFSSKFEPGGFWRKTESQPRGSREPVRAGFQTETETGFVPVTPNGVTKCDICDGHNQSQSVTPVEIGHSGFQKFFLAKRVWSQSVTIGHNQSPIWNVTGTNLCFCFLFGIRIGPKWYPAKQNRGWPLFLFSVWNPAQTGS